LDFDYLKAELDGFRSGDFNMLKEKLRVSIQESKSGNFSWGYQEMRLNVLLAQGASDDQEALRLIDSVKLEKTDFQWLDDIRLLAKCELANKVGNSPHEAELRSQFLARQPLLFEPDTAINFNLLKYQEHLKEDFRGTRARSG
jgi:hypothetical protein